MSASREIAAIVLAAGSSERFGSENKLLADLDGKPLLQHTLDALKESGLTEIVLVIGHEAERLEKTFAGNSLHLVHNPEYRQGMASSIRTGISALDRDVEAALVVLGDMPNIKPAIFKQLVEALDSQPDKDIFVPTCKGRVGNPVLWRKSMFDTLLCLRGDRGGKVLIEANPGLVQTVDVGDPGIFSDIDLPLEL